MSDHHNIIWCTCVFGILSIIQGLNAQNDCIKLDVSITQKIQNLGFHRDLHWLIETKNLDPEIWTNASCKVALRMDIGRGMFVNPDQAEDLKRLGKLDIMIEGTVDVEAPAHLGTRHVVYIFLNSSQMTEQISVTLPIHLRYQKSLVGGYGQVILSMPMLLVHCPRSNNVICGKGRSINAPTSSEDFETLRVWRNTSYKADAEEMELLVPIGDLGDYPYVAVITCIIGCTGCIYIISLLNKSGF